MIITAETSCW